MDENSQRLERVKKALGCKSDYELGKRLNLRHPQISRWRGRGFHASTAILIDSLLDLIEQTTPNILHGINIARLGKKYAKRRGNNPDYLASQMPELLSLTSFKKLTDPQAHEVYQAIESFFR